MKRKIFLEGQLFEYELTRKKVKNINLRIHSDGRISLSANSRASIEQIESFIKANSSFVIKNVARYKLAEQKRNEINNKNKNSVRLFDEGLTLVMLEGGRNFAERKGALLLLSLKDQNDEEMKQKVIESFLRGELVRKIHEIAPEILSRLNEPKLELPTFTVRKMSTRWGSCNAYKGRVSINLRLTEYNADCLEFVLSHELCHLVHPNHSKEFYKLLDSVMPIWREKKEILKRI